MYLMQLTNYNYITIIETVIGGHNFLHWNNYRVPDISSLNTWSQTVIKGCVDILMPYLKEPIP